MSLEQAQETQQRLGEIAINNSAALRFVMSEVVTNPELNRNPYWKNCAQVAQKSFNLNQKDNLGQGSDGNYKLITGNEPPMYDPRYDETAKEKKLLGEQINKAKEEGSIQRISRSKSTSWNWKVRKSSGWVTSRKKKRSSSRPNLFWKASIPRAHARKSPT